MIFVSVVLSLLSLYVVVLLLLLLLLLLYTSSSPMLFLWPLVRSLSLVVRCSFVVSSFGGRLAGPSVGSNHVEATARRFALPLLVTDSGPRPLGAEPVWHDNPSGVVNGDSSG